MTNNYIKNDDSLYWENGFGWTSEKNDATPFSDDETQTLNLPMGGHWEMKINQKQALNMLGEATCGSYDPWDLMGPYSAPTRQAILSTLLSAKMPRAKSGVNALKFHFHKVYAPVGSCEAAREKDFARWAAKQIAGL